MKFNPFSRLAWRTGVAAVLGACLALSSQAQTPNFPNRQVRMIVPFAPGNGVDILARTIADGLSKMWGQSVVVENRPGANGIVAAQEFLRAPIDGYTYFVGDIGSIAVNPSLFKKLPYDPERDMVPLTDVMAAPWVFFTTKANGIKTMAEFVERAKAEPGKLTYGSTGLGAPNYMAAEFFKIRTGIDLLGVPYRDGNQLHSAVAAGELNLMISSWATARVVMDRLQPLAVSAPARQPGYPQVPTMQEAIGLADFEVNSWAVLMGRKGAPQAILDQMQADAIKVIQSPDVQRRSSQIGIDVQGKKAADLVQMIQSEVSRYRAVIQKNGIQKD